MIGVHTCAYDLRESRLIQVHVTDKHTAESLQHFQLQRFDLLIADRGYGYQQKHRLCLSTTSICYSAICSQYLSIAGSVWSTP